MKDSGRFELKYVISRAQQRRFMDAAAHGLSVDPNGRNASYRVSSLYFDTPDYLAYWEKMDGEAVRRKYRLRYYSIDQDGGPNFASGFMEIKHRINNTVYKQRIILNREATLTILDNPSALKRLPELCRPSSPADQSTIDHVCRAAGSSHLQGAAVITYQREAWLGDVDSRLRVTFDEQCQSYAPADFRRVHRGEGITLLPADRVIMEIKFDAAIPCWIRDLLMDQGLILQRFSKYASGIESPARRQFLAMSQSSSAEAFTAEKSSAAALHNTEIPAAEQPSAVHPNSGHSKAQEPSCMPADKVS